jgi:hypothetical protein
MAKTLWCAKFEELGVERRESHAKLASYCTLRILSKDMMGDLQPSSSSSSRSSPSDYGVCWCVGCQTLRELLEQHVDRVQTRPEMSNAWLNTEYPVVVYQNYAWP